MTISNPGRIEEDVLAEQWFSFMHSMIQGMQAAYRASQENGEITQKKMAERLGKNPSFVSRCLSGQQNMTARTIHDLARAMDCRLEVKFRPLKSIPPSNNPAAGNARERSEMLGVRSEAKSGSSDAGKIVITDAD